MSKKPKYIKILPQALLAITLGIALIANPIAGKSAVKDKNLTSRSTGDGISEDEKIVHVLNRLGYGARPGDIERVKKIGLDKYIEQQLNPEHIDDHAIDARLKGLDTLAMTPEELVRAYPLPKLLNGKGKKKGEQANQTANQTAAVTDQEQPQEEQLQNRKGERKREKLM